MSLFLALLMGTVRALLSIVQLCFLVRAILSWFPIRQDNPFLVLVTMVTEPFIIPFRALCDRFCALIIKGNVFLIHICITFHIEP